MADGAIAPTQSEPPSTAEAERATAALKRHIGRARRLVEEARSFLPTQSAREAAFKRALADEEASDQD